MRLADELQELDYRGELKEGASVVAEGKSYTITKLTRPGRWGKDYIDVTVREEDTHREAVKIVARVPF